MVNESATWSPFRNHLGQIALALVSTCGAYRKETDCPFDAANYYGDPFYKEIPIATALEELGFAHTHYDRTHVEQDANVAFPLPYLKELAARQQIERLVDPAISFSGFLPQPRQLLEETAPAAANLLQNAGAEAALLVSC